MAYSTGTYTLIGAIIPVTATVDPSSDVTFNIIGAADTFAISSNTGSTVTINQTVAALNTLNLDTNGGAITLGTFAGALAGVNVTVDKGGIFTAGGTVLGIADNSDITFGTGGGSVVLGTASDFINLSFTPTFTNFDATSDNIDDKSLSLAGFTSYTVGTDGSVTIHDTTGDFSFNTTGSDLTPGTYTSLTGGPLSLVADGSGGIKIVACFLAGTGIMTPEGEKPVEALRPGELVTTLANGNVPIKAIASRAFDRLEDIAASRLRPVWISAGAFAVNVPHRDLYVSPDHSMLLDDVLVPAQLLVNGSSITQPPRTRPIEYYHVEVEPHDIILAEGAASESYLNTSNRPVAVPGVVALFPADEPRTWEDACVPIVLAGPRLEKIRAALAVRAGELAALEQSRKIA